MVGVTLALTRLSDVYVSCMSVLVFVPSGISHRIVVVDHDLSVMRHRLDRCDPNAHWNWAYAGSIQIPALVPGVMTHTIGQCDLDWHSARPGLVVACPKQGP